LPSLWPPPPPPPSPPPPSPPLPSRRCIRARHHNTVVTRLPSSSRDGGVE
jgi:hypothetical protein